MSPISTFPTQPREGPTPPTTEVQKQTLLDYLTAFGFGSQITQEEKLQFIEVSQAIHSSGLPCDGYHYEIDVGQLPEFFRTLEQRILEENISLGIVMKRTTLVKNCGLFYHWRS